MNNFLIVDLFKAETMVSSHKESKVMFSASWNL